MTRYFTILFSCIILFASCSDDSQELIFDQIDLSISQDLSAAAVYNDKVFVVGGEVFEEGVTITIEQDSIGVDRLSDKQLFGLDCTDSLCITVGQDGYFYEFIDGDWSFKRLREWGFQRDIALGDRGAVTVSGKSFASGSIYHLNEQFLIDSLSTYDAELSAVHYVGKGIYISVGYGIILRSTDDGYSWQPIAQEGDFYHSVDFVDDLHGIIVGVSGSILLTDDGGLTWNTIQSPSVVSGSRPSFLAAKYISTDLIYIVGDEGLLWQSIDSGKNWTEYQVNTIQNLNDLAVLNGYLYVVGDNGYLGKRAM